MKRQLLKTTVAATAFVLLTASALADAACNPFPCYRELRQCTAMGLPNDVCEDRFNDCLLRNGCSIP